MATQSKNDTRITFRLNRQFKELIERAASLRGQSVTDFATSTLVETARRVLQEHSTIILSDRDRHSFLAMLDADVQPNETLKKAAKRFKDRHG